MKKILIVDDELSWALSMEERLLDAGYICFQAENAETAIDLLGEITFDLALVSLNLKSAMRGHDLADILTMSYSVPVIFMTDNCDLDENCNASTFSYYGYLVKPANYQTLLSVISISLRRAAAEKILKEQSRIFEAVLENSAEGIVVADSRFNIRYFNHIFLDIFDIKCGDIYGSKLGNVMEGIVYGFDDLLESLSGRTQQARTVLETKSERASRVLMNVSCCSIEEDEPLYLFIFSDFNEIERINDEIGKS